MRFVLLLSMGSFCMNYAMDREEPVVCGSIAAGYCMEMIVVRTRERLPLMENRVNIQEAPPDPIEVRTCRDCYMQHKKKIWCCGACCCMTCTCITINSLSNIVKGFKTMTAWCFGD